MVQANPQILQVKFLTSYSLFGRLYDIDFPLILFRFAAYASGAR